LAQGEEKEVDAHVMPVAGINEIMESVRAQMEASIQQVTPAIEMQQKLILEMQQKIMAEQADAIAPVIKQLQEQMSEQAEHVASAMQGFADATMLGLHGGLHETQKLILEEARHDVESEGRHIRLEELTIELLSNITKRLDALEKKPIQPYSELKDLRKQVAEMSNFIEQYKQTIEDLETYSGISLRQAIQKLDKKEGKPDGR